MCVAMTQAVSFGYGVTKGNATRNSFISNAGQLATVLPTRLKASVTLGGFLMSVMRNIGRFKQLAALVAVFGAGLSQVCMSASAEQAANTAERALRSQADVQSSQRQAENISNEDSGKIKEARQCVRERRDGQALKLLREVVAHDPSNREAKIEMALILGYREDYRNSDRMYRALLVQDPADETAAVGLIHNLIREGRYKHARAELRQALEHHPNSIVLQEYSDQLQWNRRVPAAYLEAHRARVEVGGNYFSDSAGNRVIEANQAAEYGIAETVIARLRMNEQRLWNQSSGTANVLAGTGGFEVQPSRFLSIYAEGGVVRFADLSSRPLYAGDLALRPYPTLLLTGGLSRFPVSPTYDAAQFDLLGEGWHVGLDWRPKFVLIRGSFSRAHYSDGNRAESERGEIIHWTRGSRVAFGAGYEFSHSHFLFDPLHGYFSPDQYRRHLGEFGIRFRIGSAFRAEYLGRGGVESISNGGFTPAGELRLKHRIFLGQWAFGLDYSRLQVTQSTGAFEANSISGFLGYDF